MRNAMRRNDSKINRFLFIIDTPFVFVSRLFHLDFYFNHTINLESAFFIIASPDLPGPHDANREARDMSCLENPVRTRKTREKTRGKAKKYWIIQIYINKRIIRRKNTWGTHVSRSLCIHLTVYVCMNCSLPALARAEPAHCPKCWYSLVR